MLQNVRVAAFTVSQFSKRKPIGKREGVKFSLPTQIRVKIKFLFIMLYISWLYSGAQQIYHSGPNQRVLSQIFGPFQAKVRSYVKNHFIYVQIQKTIHHWNSNQYRYTFYFGILSFRVRSKGQCLNLELFSSQKYQF